MKLLRFFFLVVLAAAVVFIGPQLRNYVAGRDAVPPGVTLAGANIGGATAAEAAANVRKVFEAPVLVYHGDKRLVLRPEQVGFEVDAEGMVTQARAYSMGLHYVRDFLFYLLNRPPLGQDVPLSFTYDRAQLGAWLKEQAEAYDNEPTAAYANLDTLSFVPGQPGRSTDLNESAIHILNAFTRPTNREARLTLHERPSLPPNRDTLEAALRQRLERFAGIYSLYYQDLTTGDEIDVDGDTAFAGMSTVKIPILLKLYHDFDLPLDASTSRWISETVKSETASNAGANALLYRIGEADTLTGTQRVTEFARQLGLKNTFIAVPYDSDMRPPPIQTPANTNPQYNTFPDPAMQTTPKDMGILLADIGRCAEGRGDLVAAYGERITPAKCQEIVDWLEQNPMGFLIKYGVPEGTPVAHKHGYGTDSQSDVALIDGPEGPYALAIFVFQQGWVVWDMSNPLMNDLSRLVWNYYLARQGKEQLPPFDRTVPQAPQPPAES